MKRILLSLILVVFCSTYVVSSSELREDVYFRQMVVKKTYDIYSRCLVMSTIPKIIEDTKVFFNVKDNIFITRKLARTYVFMFCMSGNYDVEFNSITKYIEDIYEEI